ncbi:reverse transcriptase domain-containing protein [Tanacetum coccineum]
MYAIVNHHKVSKEIWDRVKLLMQGTSLSLQERECKLYDEFDKFTHVKGETLYHLLPEWSKFVTDVKLARDLHTTNYDQLYSYFQQHEAHANETRLLRERYQDPLALYPQHTSPTLQQVHSSQQYTPMYAAPHLPQPQINHSTSSVPPLHQYQSQISHQTSSVPPNPFHSPPMSTQPMTEFPQLYLGGQAKAVKCYNCQGERHMDRQCTQPKRPRNATWFKEKAMLAEAQESDAYDSDYDDISSTKAVLMANLSNYDSDILSKVPNFEINQNDMDNQSVQAMQHFKQTPIDDSPDSELTSDSNIIPYSQYL